MARQDPKNRSRYWWHPQVSGLSLLRADFSTHEYRPHIHQALVVAVTEQGGAIINSRGTETDCHPSALFVFNPAEVQSARMGRSVCWRYRSFYLTERAIAQVLQGLGLTQMPGFTRNSFSDEDLINGFLTLHRALESSTDTFQQRELLIEQFGCLFRRHGDDAMSAPAMPPDRALFQRAVGLMQARFDDSLQLDDIASAVGLTEFQLIDLFKRCVGLTPHAYLTQIRLYAACRALRRGRPLAEAATEAGFYDQSALTKHFKRSYGITPRQYAAAARR